MIYIYIYNVNCNIAAYNIYYIIILQFTSLSVTTISINYYLSIIILCYIPVIIHCINKGVNNN